MRIVFYTKPLQPDAARRNDRDVFVHESLSRLVASHPGHTFFLAEEGPKAPPDPADPFPGVARYRLEPRQLLGRYRKYHHQLPALLEKLDASVILSLTGGLPLKGETPSVLLLSNGASRDPALERFIRSAMVLATLSGAEARDLKAKYPAAGTSVVQVPPGVLEAFAPMGWEAREQVKDAYTNGREYFIDLDPLDDEAAVVRLLKGFSVLKKRLRSSMALVLAGERRIAEGRLAALLGNYHFRGDVLLTECGDLSARRQLVGGAYALVTASAGSGLRSPVLEALRCRVPVLAASEGRLREIAGEAALYFKPTDFADLGERFCDIYKFENMRAMLIAKADEQSGLYSWEATADALWNAIVLAGEARN